MSVVLGPQTQVNSFTIDDQSEPSITVLADGGWVVTWQSYDQDTDGEGIYQQRFNANGNSVGAPKQVNNEFMSDQSMPSVTALKDGGWVVTWQSDGQDDEYSGIYQRHYDSDGIAQSNEMLVNTEELEDQKLSSVTGLSDGGWVVTWQSDWQAGDEESGIYQKSYNANGTLRQDETRVNTETLGTQINVSVTGLSGGGWVVAWQSTDQDGYDNGIYQQRYKADGSVQDGEIRVNLETEYDQTASAITALSDGGWVVTWQTYDDDNDEYGLFQRHFAADGATQGPDIKVSASPSGSDFGQSVTGLPEGGWVVVWGENGDILQQVYNVNGAAVGGAFTIGTDAAFNGAPAVAALDDGGWVVSWQVYNDAGDIDIAQRVIRTATAEAPSGADSTIGVMEGESHTFALADFGFSDGAQSDEFQAVVITEVRGGGYLRGSVFDAGQGGFITKVVKAGDTILADDIDGLEWVPGEDTQGKAVGSVSFKVVDTGGTANGGQNTDQTANTITFDVIHLNQAPTGADHLVTTTTDAPYAFKAADFGFADGDGNALAGIVIDTLPMAGTLTLGGVAVQGGQLVTAAQIATLVWTPPATGAGKAGFMFQVKDNGGTENNGLDTAVTPNAITLAYAGHAAPEGKNFEMTVREDAKVHFTAGQFGFSDQDGDSLAGILITSLPASGALTLKGVAVNAQTTVTLADLPELVWTPAKNSFGDDLASLTFQLVDDGSSANGGITTDATPNTLTFSVTDVLDRFVGTGGKNTLTGTAGADLLIGRKGADRLTGGAGADTFVFFTKDGRDTVYDFAVEGANHDILDISAINAITSFNDLVANHMHQSGAHVIIDGIGKANSITLRNVSIGDLDAEHFLF